MAMGSHISGIARVHLSRVAFRISSTSGGLFNDQRPLKQSLLHGLPKVMLEDAVQHALELNSSHFVA